MFVYSQKIIHFADEIKRAVKDILSKELRLRVHGDRFYDEHQRTSYPLSIVIYDNKKMLGYFDPDFYEMGFHECLMHTSKKQLHDIIRHELAHYIAFIKYGNTILPHGAEFKELCQRLGWEEGVYKATSCLEDRQKISGVKENDVLRKVQKLMALSTSSNKNEAEQAMIKSQQLLLKHNIESTYITHENEEKMYLKRVMQQKKENAKMRSIARILKTFFVSVVYSRGRGYIYLQILGNEVNVEIAEYVASILNIELDKLWEQAQKNTNLKGTVAKNSFFLGLAKGYCDKVEALKREYNNEATHAVMVIEKKLVQIEAMVYKNLRSTKSTAQYCGASSALGELMGKQLNVNPAIKNGSKSAQEALFLEAKCETHD